VDGEDEQAGVVRGGEGGEHEVLGPLAGVARGLVAKREGGLVAVVAVGDVQLLGGQGAADGGAGFGVIDAREALGEALGTLPKEVVIFGVQPASVDWSPALSSEAQAAVPIVGQAVLQELEAV